MDCLKTEFYILTCGMTVVPTPMDVTMKAKGFLIDLDGVIYVQEKLIPGGIQVVRLMEERGIPHCFITNTSTMNRRQLLARLQSVGIPVKETSLFTALLAAAQYLQNLANVSCFFLTNPDLLEDFQGVPQTEQSPTHVLIGDVGEGFSYQMMNRVFAMLMDGAELLALQKNRFWLTTQGRVLDAGAFIAALEYATGKTATVFGKPSPRFFQQACLSLGLPSEQVAIIGDDLHADIQGGASAGLQTIFVRTGKDKDTSLQDQPVKPGLVLTSIADLREILSDDF